MNFPRWFIRRFHSMSIERQEQVIDDLTHSASPGFDFFLMVILSTCIATLGLITNSPAVIIGAMLVAPLMSPIIGLGLASTISNGRLLSNATSALIRGAGLAVLLAAIMTYINANLPFVSLQDLPAEILSRTHPSPIDLGIALAGGLAAAYAIAQPQLSAALPGVAIATALMPPLCTVGIGLALGRWDVAGGAALLFVTNAVTIAFASVLIFFLLGFGPPNQNGKRWVPRSLMFSAFLTSILLVPLSYVSIQFFQEASENRLINSVVKMEVAKLNGAELAGLGVTRNGNTLEMTITVRTSSSLQYLQVDELQKAIVKDLARPVSLVVNQVFVERLDPLIPPTLTLTPTETLTHTPGPSPTFRNTSTLTPSATPTYTATATLTPSPTNTPTPAVVKVVGPILPVLRLYQTPGGPEIAVLRPNQVLTVLYGEQTLNGLIWVQVVDTDGRIGWIPKVYLTQITLTPAPTSEATGS